MSSIKALKPPINQSINAELPLSSIIWLHFFSFFSAQCRESCEVSAQGMQRHKLCFCCIKLNVKAQKHQHHYSVVILWKGTSPPQRVDCRTQVPVLFLCFSWCLLLAFCIKYRTRQRQLLTVLVAYKFITHNQCRRPSGCHWISDWFLHLDKHVERVLFTLLLISDVLVSWQHFWNMKAPLRHCSYRVITGQMQSLPSEA